MLVAIVLIALVLVAMVLIALVLVALVLVAPVLVALALIALALMALVLIVLVLVALFLIPLMQLALVLLKSAHSTDTDRSGAHSLSADWRQYYQTMYQHQLPVTNNTGASTLFFACIVQKLAPAGKKIAQIYLPDLPLFASLRYCYTSSGMRFH